MKKLGVKRGANFKLASDPDTLHKVTLRNNLHKRSIARAAKVLEESLRFPKRLEIKNDIFYYRCKLENLGLVKHLILDDLNRYKTGIYFIFKIGLLKLKLFMLKVTKK